MTRTEAKKLATKIKTRYEQLPKNAGRGMESQTWDLALEVLLAWAREITNDIEKSRSLLALSSFLVGGSKSREKAHRKALESPELALKCGQCNSDQDACGTTCDESEKHYDACNGCNICPDCEERPTWVRPGANERLRGNRWES